MFNFGIPNDFSANDNPQLHILPVTFVPQPQYTYPPQAPKITIQNIVTKPLFTLTQNN